MKPGQTTANRLYGQRIDDFGSHEMISGAIRGELIAVDGQDRGLRR
jgi:hypothetical protein